MTTEEGYRAAHICSLSGLAAVNSIIGSLRRVFEVIQVRGFVNSARDFHDQSKVMNGALELLVKAFGGRGRYARAPLGPANLSGNIPIGIKSDSTYRRGMASCRVKRSVKCTSLGGNYA